MGAREGCSAREASGHGLSPRSRQGHSLRTFLRVVPQGCPPSTREEETPLPADSHPGATRPQLRLLPTPQQSDREAAAEHRGEGRAQAQRVRRSLGDAVQRRGQFRPRGSQRGQETQARSPVRRQRLLAMRTVTPNASR